jgi:amino acid adenylation domain-containing protein/non-ribosomal peptide synthase protein (TIGR01720 family)
MVLTMSDAPEGLGGAWEYNTDLFDESTIRRMAGHLQALLAAMVADPNQPVATAPLLTAGERQRILIEWNDTATPFPDDRTLHALVEEQVARQPEHPAAVFVQHGRAETMSYAQLDRRANQLAHLLRSHGAGPGTLVAIALPRSLHLPVAILGVLKAGAAFLPVDPAYPAERVRFMLEDSAAPIVLAHPGGVGSAKGAEGRTMVIVLDAAWEFRRGWPTTPPEDGAGPDDLAYCIYTSGSTGTPKGTLLRHRGLANLAQVQRRAFEITPDSRILQFFPLSFDASVWDFTMALANGATLVLAPQDVLTSGPELRQLLQDQAITTITMPPSLLAIVEPGESPALRTVIAGGERCTRDIVQRWAPGRRFFNAYGPTEATVVASLALCAAEDEGEPTIGSPLDNFQLYVVDANLQPVPIGVPGELLIAGVGLARGYLHRPELTAERFRTVIIDGQERRVYRSGDLVRWRPDGRLDFLGRLDHQVKLRGFRIELGEIEAVLTTHPAVRDAAAIIHELAPGDRRLAAYLVFEPAIDPPPSIGDLRTFLAQRLPDYMIPAAFVNLENLPLTPAGKIDRKALPAPDAAARLETGQAYQAPRTEAERILAAIWADVLRVERVGVHDNFFEIGGDSIMSIQVVARASQAGLRFTPKQMFQTPTIAGLAAAAEVVEAAIVDADQGLVEGPVLLTPIQRWFLELDLPERNHWNQSVLLAVKEQLDPERLRVAITALLAHHDALRLRLVPSAAGWQLANAGLDGGVPLQLVDLSNLPEAERSSAVEAQAIDAQGSLDLSEGPLLRVVYWDFGPHQAGRLLLVIHHLAVDAVSWRILLEDLQTAYELAGEQPGAVPLPAKTTSFRRWAEQLATYAHSEAIRGELDYWLDQGAGWVAPLPVDHALGVNTEASAETISVVLAEDETQQLLHESHAAYGTEIDDILLTALAQACEHWTGSSTLLVAREGHGRTDALADEHQPGSARIDLSRTVGWFTSMIPLRLELPFGSDPGSAIMAIKEQLRNVPHDGMGFGLLRYLAGDPDTRDALAALPQPELSFNYLGQFDQVLPQDSPLAPARESSGPDRGPGNLRPHLIDVTSAVTGGRLAFAWTFSRHRHEVATIQQLADGFLQALRELISHCVSPEAGGYTPSDFNLAKLSQSQLDKIVKKSQQR